MLDAPLRRLQHLVTGQEDLLGSFARSTAAPQVKSISLVGGYALELEAFARALEQGAFPALEHCFILRGGGGPDRLVRCDPWHGFVISGRSIKAHTLNVDVDDRFWALAQIRAFSEKLSAESAAV